jgi:hypothetical protein
MIPHLDMSGTIAAILAAAQQAQQGGQPDWAAWSKMVADWAQNAEHRLQALEKAVKSMRERMDLEIP